MKKVMLWGDGPHLELYDLAYCFLDGVDALTVNAPLSGEYTDLVITEPFQLTPDRIREIRDSGFRGTVMAEKPAARSPQALKQILDALDGCSVYLVHTRLFAPPLPLPDAGEVVIDWPNRYATGMDPLWNTLPNAADALYVCNGGQMPALADAGRRGDGLCFLFQLRERKVTLRITPGDEGQKVSVSGASLQWPNAFDTLQAAWQAAHGANPEASHAHELLSIRLSAAACELLQRERK